MPYLIIRATIRGTSREVTVGTTEATRPTTRIDWEDFLSRHDLIWSRLPRSYGEAPFLGNGLLGSLLFFDEETGALKLEIFRSDVQDHRGRADGWTAYSRPRFVIGHYLLHTRGAIRSGSMRLDLWNAELTGTLVTDGGEISLSHHIHATEELMFVELEFSGDENIRWEWHPGEAKTTRSGVPYTRDDIVEFAGRYGDHYLESLQVYKPNPDHRLLCRDGIDLCTQDLLAGGQYATAWGTTSQVGQSGITAITIANTFPERDAEEVALSTVRAAIGASISEFVRVHREWWHAYYRLSFLSLPDARLETFYWIQVYKLACATRADKPMMDTSGPWFQPTPWPYITTDLNIQLCYWPVCASNRLELGESLVRGLHNHRDALIENVRPVEWQSDSAYLHITCAQDLIGPRDDDMRYYDCVGNLTWTLHNMWMIYRFSMDDTMLREKLLPLLERSVNFYLHLLEDDAEGVLHLRPTYSPEYPNNPNNDCNYDLALLKWACRTLLDSCERLGIDHAKSDTWQDVLDRLVDFPVDKNGLRVGADHGITVGHSTYSHLLMIYPLYDLNIEQERTEELVRTSVSHWFGSGSLHGFSITGASSLSSAIGDGNAALRYLKELDEYLEPNTLYLESGPCMETPLSAAQCIHDMLIQSWGGIIRVFPAVADEWQDVVFHHLRTEGAFLVSASRKEGKTEWMHIESIAGEECRVIIDIVDL